MENTMAVLTKATFNDLQALNIRLDDLIKSQTYWKKCPASFDSDNQIYYRMTMALKNYQLAIKTLNKSVHSIQEGS